MKLVKILSAAGLVVAGFAGVTTVQAQQQENAPQGPMCTVTLERDQPAGVFDVSRQVFEDGSCNCYVYTGPETQPGQAEARVSGIVQSQRCPDARVMEVQGRNPASGSGAWEGIGSSNGALPVLLFAGAAAGVVLLIEDGEGEAPDPITPVSP